MQNFQFSGQKKLWMWNRWIVGGYQKSIDGERDAFFLLCFRGKGIFASSCMARFWSKSFLRQIRFEKNQLYVGREQNFIWLLFSDCVFVCTKHRKISRILRFKKWVESLEDPQKSLMIKKLTGIKCSLNDGGQTKARCQERTKRYGRGLFSAFFYTDFWLSRRFRGDCPNIFLKALLKENWSE